MNESQLDEMSLLHMVMMNDKKIVTLKCIDYMLCQGLNINARKRNGLTAAHIDVMDERKDILQLLMAHQMNPRYEDLFRKNPIDYAQQDTKIYHLLRNYFEYGPGAPNIRNGKDTRFFFFKKHTFKKHEAQNA
ncbi:ankyrin repeat domain-containing protein 53-like [Clytia hemisphaerica]|uniref:Uncharacterized protein n=1 Tax=Clytia hemisphaerica TaxID=252671 RepID=A0A7M5XJ71_9CNID